MIESLTQLLFYEPSEPIHTHIFIHRWQIALRRELPAKTAVIGSRAPEDSDIEDSDIQAVNGTVDFVEHRTSPAPGGSEEVSERSAKLSSVLFMFA